MFDVTSVSLLLQMEWRQQSKIIRSNFLKIGNYTVKMFLCWKGKCNNVVDIRCTSGFFSCFSGFLLFVKLEACILMNSNLSTLCTLVTDQTNFVDVRILADRD